nr:MAG TPA: hypothetical protein [Caudoviricetes sp.]
MRFLVFDFLILLYHCFVIYIVFHWGYSFLI